jgi:hypothetical protein
MRITNGWRGWGAAAVVVAGLGAVATAQQSTPIFRMDCGTGGSAYPLCGFSALAADDAANGVHFTRTRVPAGSPSGRDAIQFDLIPSGSHVQHYLGWRWDRPPAVPQGASRYFRFRLRVRSPISFAGNESSWGAKFIILGDTCESNLAPTRVIVNLGASATDVSRAFLRIEQNIAGPPSRIDTSPLTPDVWHSVQVKVRSSSSESSADGLLSVYLNADNRSEGSPTLQSSGPFRLRTAGWSGDCPVGFGYFAGTTLRPGGRASFQVADFEYDDAFDASWNIPTATAPPSPPTSLRIVVP